MIECDYCSDGGRCAADIVVTYQEYLLSESRFKSRLADRGLGQAEREQLEGYLKDVQTRLAEVRASLPNMARVDASNGLNVNCAYGDGRGECSGRPNR